MFDIVREKFPGAFTAVTHELRGTVRLTPGRHRTPVAGAKVTSLTVNTVTV
jgi:hypothetical protein